MSNLAMAGKHPHPHHHHHHHHGLELPHVHLPPLGHLGAKLSSLMSVAQGQQGPGPQRMLLIGLAILAVLIVVAVRKMRRS